MMVANLGADDPIGSVVMNVISYISNSYPVYLKAGKGDDCAGHVRAMLKPDPNRNEDTLDTDENLGAAEPTGSRKEQTRG